MSVPEEVGKVWNVLRFCTSLEMTDSASEKVVECVMIKTVTKGKKPVFEAWEKPGSVLH